MRSKTKSILPPSGLLILDKPSGPTSHDIVDAVRRGTGIRRVGHTGTLDPLASGVLVVCVGAATRLSEYLVGADKRYTAVVRFGAATDTYDAGGTITCEAPLDFDRDQLARALSGFRGEQAQTPPPYSAVRIKGRKAYQLARAGKTVALEPRRITIHSLDLLDWTPPDATLEVECSSGTYIRSLAHDLGLALDGAAHLARLTRTRAGRFRLEDAATLEALRQAFADKSWDRFLILPADALPDLPALTLTDEQARTLAHGGRIPAPRGQPGLARALTPDGHLLAIVDWLEPHRAYQPRKVFPPLDDPES